MGDGDMSNYAVSKWFAAHKLTVNILAHHVEFKTTLDLDKLNETPRLPGGIVQLAKELKYDSCGIFSVGPIASIRHQGARAPLLDRGCVAPARRRYRLHGDGLRAGELSACDIVEGGLGLRGLARRHHAEAAWC